MSKNEVLFKNKASRNIVAKINEHFVYKEPPFEAAGGYHEEEDAVSSKSNEMLT
jgi:hypothetical protein